jgi:hypothetical protein
MSPSVVMALGRPVYTHELGSDLLRQEFLAAIEDGQ